MTNQLTMIMPMAGRGSRFAQQGVVLPKPLIEIAGKPFFYWATLGVFREFHDFHLVYVVLREHVELFEIDRKIKYYFPYSTVVIVEQVTSGALETALVGLSYVEQDSSLIINDCDHAFSYSQLSRACRSLIEGADGFLTHFHSCEAHYSYAKYSNDGLLLETAEKEVISNLAIAGIYGFRNSRELRAASERYSCSCPYDELFISGVYNEMLISGAQIKGFSLDYHVPFGTPLEYHAAIGRIPDLEALERGMR